jgi:hypothetical protein
LAGLCQRQEAVETRLPEIRTAIVEDRQPRAAGPQAGT